jgi:hypothetical protein
MRIEQRLAQDEDKLKLYVHLCRWYGGRFHENKFRGQYEDPMYGTHRLNDVRKLARLVEQVDIELIQTGGHLTVNITLDSFITDLNI